MTKHLIPQLAESIYELMQTMFYFEVELLKDPGTDLFKHVERSSLKTGCIRFSGDYSGSIYLCISFKALKTLACNFLGQESFDRNPETYLDSTLKEALNMIAGNALTRMDKTSYVKLGIPELVDSSDLNPGKDFVIFNTAKGKMASFCFLDT